MEHEASGKAHSQDATVPDVVPGAVFYGFFAVAANTAIASYFDLPATLSLETKKTVGLVFWGVTVAAVVGAAQALILGSVMRELSIGNVPDYQLLVNREAADIAAATISKRWRWAHCWMRPNERR